MGVCVSVCVCVCVLNILLFVAIHNSYNTQIPPVTKELSV